MAKMVYNAQIVRDLLWEVLGNAKIELCNELDKLGWLAQQKPVTVKNWDLSPEVLSSNFFDEGTTGWFGNGLPDFPTVEIGEGFCLLCTKAQKEKFLRLEESCPDFFLGIAYGDRPYAIGASDITDILVVDDAPEERPEVKKPQRPKMPRPKKAFA